MRSSVHKTFPIFISRVAAMSTWDKPLTFDSSSSTLQTNTFDSGFGSSSSFQPVAFQPVSFDGSSNMPVSCLTLLAALNL